MDNLFFRTLLEISYNQKSSPKKLFAETSKKKNYIHLQYQNAVVNTNPNNYVTCLTDENNVRMPNFEEKLDKNIKNFMVCKIF